jgi:Spy/CpxP family protein refolding chaperone
MGKLTITILTTFIVICMSSLAFGDDWGRGHGGGPPGKEGDISTIPELKLRDEQVLQIKALREAHLREVKPLLDMIGAKRKELKTLWLMTTPNRDKITALQTDIGKLRNVMQDKMIDYRHAIFEILTPEQQNRLESAIQQRKFNPGPRWGKKRQDSQGTVFRCN